MIRLNRRGSGRKGKTVYTDIHCHVIWGVDDGAETEEETRKLLRDAAADGIDRIIVTSHVTPGVYRFPEDVFQRHFARAEEYIRQEGLGITLYQGAELLYTEMTPRLLQEGQARTLAGSRYALIEFSPTDSWDHISGALQKVYRAGFVPVIAHMERYPAVKTLDQVKELKKKYQALVQINARTLTRKIPLLRRKFFDGLFREELADFIATDTHAMPGRETCMREGMEAIAAKYGEETARRLIRRPEIILDDGGR